MHTDDPPIRMTPLLQSLASLRARAWGQSDDPAMAGRWIDSWDEMAQHHIIFRGERLVGAVRFTLHDQHDELQDFHILGHVARDLPLPIAQPMRLVVDPDFRSQGIARALDWIIANAPFHSGAQSIIATTGSSELTAHRHEIMLKNGWKCAGQASGKSSLPIDHTKPPLVYFRIRGTT